MVTVTAGNSAGDAQLVFVNELAVIVDFFSLFALPWTINQRKFTSVHF